MKMIYEVPAAEVINFASNEMLAVITDENVGGTPEESLGSKDF